MSSVSVSVDDSTIARRSSGSITGVIFFRMLGKPFPADDWSDFPIVLLGWWLEALASLYLGQDRCELEFMDGPYAVFVSRNGDETIRLAPHRNGLPSGEEVIEKLSDLSLELLLVANECRGLCRDRLWSGGDVSALSDSISALKTASNA